MKQAPETAAKPIWVKKTDNAFLQVSAEGLLSCRVKVFRIISAALVHAPPTRGTILLLRDWPPKILIEHVKILSVVHVLKLITVSTFSKKENKIPEVLLASPCHRKVDMLQERNKKKSWKINKLPGYMLSTVIESLPYIFFPKHSLGNLCWSDPN